MASIAAFETLREKPTALSRAFFSPENLDAIQSGLMAAAGSNGYKISRQSDEHIAIAMRYVYQEHGHTPQASVGFLDDLVLKLVVPSLLANIKHYLFYLRDQSTSNILPRAQLTGTDKQLFLR